MLYNRASADPAGKPWSERKKLVWWDEDVRRWVGDDIPDFPDDLPPGPRPAAGTRSGRPRCAATTRSSCRPTARPGCSRPNGVVDGPLPTHYEPDESPVRNPLHGPRGKPDPATVRARPDNPANPAASTEVFPFVLTASRLTEHLHRGRR